MTKLTHTDLLGLEQYARQRAELRARIASRLIPGLDIHAAVALQIY